MKKLYSFPAWIYVAVASIVYITIWSFIGILKILALNAYVFDLGINSERGWIILHTNLGLHRYLIILINSGIVYPLSPLTGSGNFFAMIIFQAISIGIVGPALYLIAKEKGLKSGKSMFLSFIFFLYFPVYGILWFDFHYQVFFMPLFVFAYLQYLRKNYTSSVLLFFLSGLVRYPYSIFPLAFALIELLPFLRNRQPEYEHRRMVSMLVLLVLMVVWTLLGFLIFGLSSTIPHSGVSQYSISDASIWSRIYVVFLFLGPLLFLPVLRIKWIILIFPAFYLFLTSSYTWYVYPHVFQGQYAAGVAPFLFLGLIDFFCLSVEHEIENNKTVHHRRRILQRKSGSRPILAILAILLFLNLFFAPFSPLNNQFGDQFNFWQNTSYNAQQYSELGSMLKMIPSSDPYIMYQNNIPEILPGNIPPGGVLLMGGYMGSFTNVSASESINNSWQVNAGGNIATVPIDFALADASNPNFYLVNNSVYSIVREMYESGKYGILSEGYGLILLQRGFNGTIKNYVPENVTISGGSLRNVAAVSPETSGMTSGGARGIDVIYGHTPLYLFPGRFNLSVYLNLHYPANVTNSSSIVLGVYSGNNELMSIKGNISTSSNNSSRLKMTFSFALNGITGNVRYTLYWENNSSSMNVSKIVVSQTSPFQNYRMY